ncbi:MAG: hypothetical protein ACC645_25505, partial [Pirellulales bacterium]
MILERRPARVNRRTPASFRHSRIRDEAVLPATCFIEILRGIVLRGADSMDLVPWVVGLTICCVAILMASVTRSRWVCCFPASSRKTNGVDDD